MVEVGVLIFFFGQNSSQCARDSSLTRFLDHTQRRTTVSRTPLNEWLARRRVLYLTTLTTDRHPCPRQDSNPQSNKRVTACPRFRPRRQWNRHDLAYLWIKESNVPLCLQFSVKDLITTVEIMTFLPYFFQCVRWPQLWRLGANIVIRVFGMIL